MSYDNYTIHRVVPRVLPVSEVGIGRTYCTIHGEIGKSAWIAQILGVHTSMIFIRSYCKKKLQPEQWGLHDGRIIFKVTQPGIYEFRFFCIDADMPGKYKNWSGFCMLRKSDDPYMAFEPLSKTETFRLFAHLEDAPLFINNPDLIIRNAAIEMLRGG